MQNDIDFQESENNTWNPIYLFKGCLDGNYNQIQNVYIETTEVAGLVRSNYGTIKNLENCEMKTSEEMKTKEFTDLLNIDNNIWKTNTSYPILYWQ